MAKLTSKQRLHLSTTEFALPGRRFPINDVNHARAALSMSARSEHVGNITPAQRATIDRRANAVLHRPKKA